MQMLPRLSGCPATRGRAGFTLIEILIVISIIGLVASLILVAIQQGRKKAMVAATRVEVSSLGNALEQYVQDESVYPGQDLEPDPERNDFPLLFNALFGKKRPGGPGGRSAPYTKYDESKVNVWDNDAEDYRPATVEEIRDLKTEKYLMDPLGKVYVYRANKGKTVQNWMRNTESADIYSFGLNGEDDTKEENENSDDIGNW
jgi:prepilin-type N-terminal cleavage/methylation domain-containing protein